MKAIKIISYVLMTSLLISLFILPSYADTGEGGASQPTEGSFDTFAEVYFNNLGENFGNNKRGSCNYVAAAMLLSFYDTYWNDDIIPEYYESNTYLSGSDTLNFETTNSPGIFYEPDEIANVVDPNNLESNSLSETGLRRLSQYIDIYSRYYFHFNLLKIGKDEYNAFNYSDGVHPLGISSEIRDQVLDDYLFGLTKIDEVTGQEVSVFSREQIEFETCGYNNEGDAATLAFIRQKVSQGIPVIVSGGPTDLNVGKNGHAFIAYSCDETNIYCHLGWTSNSINKPLSETNYRTDLRATCLNIQNLEHKCSDNYIRISTANSEMVKYCACTFGGHPLHEHTISRSYDNNEHTDTCTVCGYSETAAHTFNYVSASDEEHFCGCDDCEFSYNEAHNMQRTFNSTQHIDTCVNCGHIVTALHDVSTRNTSKGHEKTCSQCDYYSLTSHNYVLSINGRTCKICGYVDDFNMRDEFLEPPLLE
ncbi:MAG: hypothetical protein IKL79_04765 [Clostridia bacterium]|nr:hypothetical protein [Clostridia bacterium]